METEKNSYFSKSIKKYFPKVNFNNSIIYSLLYFILLISIIIIIFSSSYITINLILTLFFSYLFFSQLYKFFTSKEKNYLLIIVSFFIISVLLIINFIIPNDNSILENINNPKMNGTIIIIIYITVIYSLLFIFSLIYSTYNQNKEVLYWSSIILIILYLIYIVYFNYISSSSSSFLIYILVTIPFISSIIFIIYYAYVDTIKVVDNTFLNNTSFQKLLENPNYVTPTSNDKKDNSIHYILKFLLVIYLIIFFICFILFLTNTSSVINNCEVSEYILYIINGILIIVLFSITINMTTNGLNIPSIPLSQMLSICALIIYNIFLSKNLNDSCYEFIKNNASIVVTISYIITFYMYYKIIFNNCKIGDDLYLLIYFVILVVLFIIVVFNINNSKLSTESSFNDYINIYIYTIIGYASFFTVGFILLFIKKYFSLENIFMLSSIPPKDEFIEYANNAFYFIIGFYILFSILTWIIELGNSLYKNNSLNASTIIISLCIIIVNMAILFKLISYSSFYQTSPLLQFVIGSVFYIPCILVSVLDYLTGYYNDNKQLITNKLKSFQFNRTDIILLILTVILYIIYFTYPIIYTKISSQDGMLLLKEPIYLDNEKLLATHEYLSIKDNINPNKENRDKEIHPYNYALSFWIYIDSNSSINSKNNYCSILNYGYNPNIKYKGSDNSFIVSLNNKNDQYFLYDDTYELDNENNVIIYKTNKLFLQKWNNIIINYNGSILDIFINGILEKSFKEIIPYMKNDNITVGSENGIHSGICNIVYFNSSLTLEKISYIYNSVKMLNPPILLNYYDRLYMSSLQIENVTYDFGLKQVEPNKKLDYVK